MNVNEIKELLKSKEYDFLKGKHLGENVIMLALGGSYAYGMNTENSDVDVRGIALNTKKEILLGTDFEQVVNTETDTTVYSINKMFKLLSESNPNTIEILGCKPEHYLYTSNIGKELLYNKNMFLSRKCIPKFVGYANSQLIRLKNKSSRLLSQTEKEENILKSIHNAEFDFVDKYASYTSDEIKLYIDKSDNENMDSEIFMDINLKHYPLRDYMNMWNSMKSVVSTFDKFGQRNKKAVEHNKLGKHMAHLIRVYLMGIDILEKKEIITYREEEHDLLMSIRNGEYLDDNKQPKEEFFDILNDCEKRFEYAKENTDLPASPDYNRIDEFKMYVNEKIVNNDL